MDKNIILSGKSIVKTYGNITVLNGIDIDIYKNDFTVVMGQSGSGKSTLLYVLSGMDQVTKGKVFYKGRNISGLKEKNLQLFVEIHLVLYSRKPIL